MIIYTDDGEGVQLPKAEGAQADIHALWAHILPFSLYIPGSLGYREPSDRGGML